MKKWSDIDQNMPSLSVDQKGFSFLELMIAMFMMVLVSAMLYSIVNVGISFASKGEERLITGERQRAFLDLLHRQIHGTWYSSKEKKLKISVENNVLQLVTTNPLLNRDAHMVMAFYYYDRGGGRLYYNEKLDFYNPEYFEDYDPVIDEMFVLLEDANEFGVDYDEKEGLVTVAFAGYEYDFVPRCWVEGDDE